MRKLIIFTNIFSVKNNHIQQYSFEFANLSEEGVKNNIPLVAKSCPVMPKHHEQSENHQSCQFNDMSISIFSKNDSEDKTQASGSVRTSITVPRVPQVLHMDTPPMRNTDENILSPKSIHTGNPKKKHSSLKTKELKKLYRPLVCFIILIILVSLGLWKL